jgi:phytoene synthase
MTLPQPINGFYADQNVAQSMQQAKSSFVTSLPLFSMEARQSIQTIYAFCRAVDDIADDDTQSREQRLVALAAWRNEVDRLSAGQTPHSIIGLELQKSLISFAIPVTELSMMIDGMAMDVEGGLVAPSQAILSQYKRRVAGSVGVMVMAVLAEKTPEVELFALTLGDALQTINILRDVDEDAARGRLYVPREILEEAGILLSKQTSIIDIIHHTAFDHACRTLASEADHALARCDKLLQSMDRSTLRPVLMMWGVYGGYLKRLKQRGWATPRKPIRISRLGKWCYATLKAFGW